MKRTKTIRFVDSDIEVPIVEFSLDNGATGYAVLDTGSETTMFDKEFVQDSRFQFKIRRSKEKISFIGLHGTAEVPVIYLDTTLNIQGGKLEIKDAMLHNLAPIGEERKVSAIIGTDVLNKINAKINFEDKTITIDDLSGE